MLQVVFCTPLAAHRMGSIVFNLYVQCMCVCMYVRACPLVALSDQFAVDFWLQYQSTGRIVALSTIHILKILWIANHCK